MQSSGHYAIEHHNDILGAFLRGGNARHVIPLAYGIDNRPRVHTRKIAGHVDTPAYLPGFSSCNSLIGHKGLQKQHGLAPFLLLHQAPGLLQLLRPTGPERKVICGIGGGKSIKEARDDENQRR